MVSGRTSDAGKSTSRTTNARWKTAVLATVGALAALSTAPAAAAEGYSFVGVPVANVPRQKPSINNLGRVSFRGGGVFVSDGLTATRVAAAGAGGLGANVAFDGSTWINDAGQVAFGTRLDGIFRADPGGTSVLIADSTDQLPGYTFSREPAVNNAGVVAFVAGPTGTSTTDARLLVGSGGPVTQLAALGVYDLGDGKPEPDINDAGVISIQARNVGTAREGTYLVGSDGTMSPVATSTNRLQNYGGPAVNQAGHVLLSDLNTGELKSGIAGALTVRASTAGPYSAFGGFSGRDGGASINDLDQIAFRAYLDPYSEGRYGIFTGPNPLTDTVIRTGDVLNGSTITFLDLGQSGLNNAGQIAFYAEFASGASGVFIATPVPEPSVGLAATGLLVLSWRSRGASRRAARSSLRVRAGRPRA